jgi:vacuolar-type H+-ATPase subunit I/STV1
MEGQSTNIRTKADRELRERAVERLRKKSEFRAHLLSYALVNGFLVIIWAITGASFFWPVFPIAGWGIGLTFHAWDVYRRQEFSEEQIQREIQRL